MLTRLLILWLLSERPLHGYKIKRALDEPGLRFWFPIEYAAIYSLLGTAQLNGLNIEAYLKLLLDRLPDHPVNRVEELLSWAVAAELPALRLAA